MYSMDLAMALEMYSIATSSMTTSVSDKSYDVGGTLILEH